MDIKSTEATFRANATVDPVYDAAVVYWNYSQDSSYDKTAALRLVNDSGSVSQLGTGLKPNKSYNAQAYIEPLVWEDPKLVENLMRDRLPDANYANFTDRFRPDLSKSWSKKSSVKTRSYYGLYIRPDGEYMFIPDSNNVKRYKMPEAWDLTDMFYDDHFSSQGGRGVHFKPDGTKMFVSRYNYNKDTAFVNSYNLSKPWDVSTDSKVNSLNTTYNGKNYFYGLQFSPDGTKLFTSERDGKVISYELSEPWNLSTARQESTLSTISRSYALTFTPDGTKMFITNGYEIHSYKLSNPWDLSSASKKSSISLSNNGANGIFFRHNGEELFIAQEIDYDETVTKYVEGGG